MSESIHERGVTLIELLIAVGVAAAVLVTAGIGMNSITDRQRVKGAARDLADLLIAARGEAIRTRTNHVVFFQDDTGGSDLVNPQGTAQAALLIRDADGDGAPDAGEYVAAVPFIEGGDLSWGVTAATVPAPGDPTPDGSNPPPSAWTFSHDASDTNWVVFGPDGMPRSFDTGPYEEGEIGSGTGAVYVTDTDAERDYAVVLAPLGGVKVHAWNPGGGSWAQ